MSATGGESITQCSNHDDNWCCNADAVHVNCCQESPSPRPFFALQDGKAYATVGSKTANSAPPLASITGLAEGDGDDSNKPSSNPSSAPASSAPSDKPSDKPSDATSESAESAPTDTTPLTSLETKVSSGTAGISTLVVTTVVQQTDSPDPTEPQGDSKKSKIPVIVGCAVGIPLALALIGILIWLLRKRSKQNAAKKANLTSPSTDWANGSPEFTGGAKFGAGGAAAAEKNRNSDHVPPPNNNVPELAGQGVGPGRPVSNIAGKAELDTGSGFAAGAVPYGPNLVGVGGGNGSGNPSRGHTPNTSWGSAPPRYESGMAGAGAHGNGVPEGVAEAPDTSVQRPAEDQQQYVAYRPPGGAPYPTGEGAHAHPGAVEMPTVTTPPEERGQA